MKSLSTHGERALDLHIVNALRNAILDPSAPRFPSLFPPFLPLPTDNMPAAQHLLADIHQFRHRVVAIADQFLELAGDKPHGL